MKKFIWGGGVLILLGAAFIGWNLIQGGNSAAVQTPEDLQKEAEYLLPRTNNPADIKSVRGKILFAGRPAGVSHVYTMNADGTNITQLTSGPYGDVTPEWSFDGTKITFQREENGPAVYTMNADGSDLKRISGTPGRDVLPSWSPDGTKLIFTHVITPPTKPDEVPVTSLMTVHADGSDPQTIWSDGSFNMEPRYSPDGSKVVFMCGKPGVGIEVCLINADGSGFKKLTDLPAVHGDPHWSHDGTKIAFASNREGGDLVNIFVMDADGSNVKQLTHFKSGEEAGDVGWSPDDTMMAFQWDRGGQGQSIASVPAEIWYMNADGTNQRSTGIVCSGIGCAPRWQPTK